MNPRQQRPKVRLRGLAAAAPGLDSLPGIHDADVDGTRARFEVDTEQLPVALSHLVGFGVRNLTSQPPTLEELFLRHYGDEITS